LPKPPGILGTVRGLFRLDAAKAERLDLIEKPAFTGGFDGGRDRDRTCDPYDVNVVLSR
jgi:hypothetical protein